MKAKVIRTCFFGLVSVFLTVLLTACGGGGGDEGGTGGMSQAEIEAISQQISRAAVRAINGATITQATASSESESQDLCEPESKDSLYESQYKDSLYEPQSISCSELGCMVNIPISHRTICTAGGKMEVTGRIHGSIGNTGTGMIQFHLIQTISDWRCVSDYVINGDPYISVVGLFTFISGAPATQQSISINGGYKWGTTAAESCQIHLTTNFPTIFSGETTTSGTVCGRQVYVTF